MDTALSVRPGGRSNAVFIPHIILLSAQESINGGADSRDNPTRSRFQSAPFDSCVQCRGLESGQQVLRHLPLPVHERAPASGPRFLAVQGAPACCHQPISAHCYGKRYRPVQGILSSQHT